MTMYDYEKEHKKQKQWNTVDPLEQLDDLDGPMTWPFYHTVMN